MPSTPKDLRTHLLWLTLGTLLPVLLFASAAAFVLAGQQRDSVERGARERVRALLTALDADLRSSLEPLLALAQSQSLIDDDLARFHALALRVKAGRPDWVTVSLASPSGQQLVNVQEPYGTPLATVTDRTGFEAMLASGQPAVSDLAFGTRRGRYNFAVRVPVLREGRIHYVLSAVVDPASIRRLLDAQRFPSDWIGVVVDGKRQIVARTVGPDTVVGQPASKDLQAALAANEEGWFRGTTIEGLAVYTPYSRSRVSGWAVAMGIPSASVEAAARQALATMALGTALALGLAFLVARLLGRRIALPIATLAQQARTLGSGNSHPPTVASGIRELDELARAFASADDALHCAERERRELFGKEQQARVDAEAANRSKDEFLAMLGHELRNPLGAISNASYLLRLCKTPEELERAQSVIQRQVKHLARLVDDLLDVSRVTSGKIALVCAPLDLGPIVRRVADTLAGAGVTARHELILDLDPVCVNGDETRLEQVVTNLLTNAARYTPTGGHIWVSVKTLGKDAVLRVADDGIGIPAELLARVFDLFVQGERSIERAAGGLGIGLTLVRRLVEMQGGSVVAESPGVAAGSCFTVRLPAIGLQAVATFAPPRIENESGGAPLRILVVEDSTDVRASMCDALRAAGHEVRECSDGQAGLEQALAWRPDIALIDIGLPELDGYAVAKRIRASAPGADIRLMALTGYGLAEDRQKSLDAGFDWHWVKPIDLEELLRVLGAANSGGEFRPNAAQP